MEAAIRSPRYFVATRQPCFQLGDPLLKLQNQSFELGDTLFERQSSFLGTARNWGRKTVAQASGTTTYICLMVVCMIFPRRTTGMTKRPGADRPFGKPEPPVDLVDPLVRLHSRFGLSRSRAAATPWGCSHCTVQPSGEKARVRRSADTLVKRPVRAELAREFWAREFKEGDFRGGNWISVFIPLPHIPLPDTFVVRTILHRRSRVKACQANGDGTPKHIDRSAAPKLQQANATDNPAAAKNYCVEETPDPPLGFIGLFVGSSVARSNVQRPSRCVKLPMRKPVTLYAGYDSKMPVQIEPSSRRIVPGHPT